MSDERSVPRLAIRAAMLAALAVAGCSRPAAPPPSVPARPHPPPPPMTAPAPTEQAAEPAPPPPKAKPSFFLAEEECAALFA